MNLLELADKWEREADGGANRTYYKCARDLRAALPEQPLSERFESDFDILFMLLNYIIENAGPGSVNVASAKSRLKRMKADLDNYHDEGRELLNELQDFTRRIKNGMTASEDRAAELNKRIRKHLGGESDAE